MTVFDPPRIALSLLKWAIGDDQPLVGDLLEEYQRRRSNPWFWRQVMSAVVCRPAHCHPRRLVPQRAPSLFGLGSQSHPSALSSLPMSEMPPVEINMSGIPVNGIGGLGLLTVIVFITLVLPQAWWLTVVGVAGGIVLGTMLVLSRRRHGISPDDNGDRSVFHLGASAQAVGATSSEGARPRTPRVLTSVVAQLR